MCGGPPGGATQGVSEPKPHGLQSEVAIAFRLAEEIDPLEPGPIARSILRANREAREREVVERWRAEWSLMWAEICWHIRLEVYTKQLDRFGPRVLDWLKRLQNQIDNLAVDIRKLEKRLHR